MLYVIYILFIIVIFILNVLSLPFRRKTLLSASSMSASRPGRSHLDSHRWQATTLVLQSLLVTLPPASAAGQSRKGHGFSQITKLMVAAVPPDWGSLVDFFMVALGQGLIWILWPLGVSLVPITTRTTALPGGSFYEHDPMA